MEPTKPYSLSTAARRCGFLKQMIIYAFRNKCMTITRRKGGSKVFRIKWLAWQTAEWGPRASGVPLGPSPMD